MGHALLAVRLLEPSVLPLSSKEIVEGIILWAFGFYMGRKHVVLPLQRIHAHARHQTMLAEEMHHRLEHGEPHPRVQARIERGEHTPTMEDT
jgi:hypothetical protein